MSSPPLPSGISIPKSIPPLDASTDARQIIRLVQCTQCARPLREPVTLPCGNTLCKQCIPALRRRANISYPATANRLQGFPCPFTSCGKGHVEGDCSVDVVVNKILDAVLVGMKMYGDNEASQVLSQLEVVNQSSVAGASPPHDGPTPSRVLPGGRLVATYNLAEMGELPYNSDVIYSTTGSTSGTEELDTKRLRHIKSSTRSEIDCQVCYGLFLDPLTGSCGHTLCRKCLHRALDHSNLCPVCRRPMDIPPGVNAGRVSSNIFLTHFLSDLHGEALASRRDAARLEDLDGPGELDTPLFVCTVSFPYMPTLLHIFEPRYRLMIRRVIQSGVRKFGMLLYNPRREVQGELGRVSFYEYGTMLSVVNMQLMPDGRSLVETVGVSRFRVIRHSILDGYTIGKVERIGDISVAEEEAIEAAETSSPPKALSSPAEEDPVGGRLDGAAPGAGQEPAPIQDLDLVPTQELMVMVTSFIARMQEQNASWLNRGIAHAYGERPDDPALFPWWFASIIPTPDTAKYEMLLTSSVRERLKLCVVWAAELEAQTW